MFDLLIRNAELIDPASGMHGKHDVAITDGRIVRLGGDLSGTDACRILDAAGKLLVPGLIDLHAHVYWGMAAQWISDLNAPPDLIGVRSGVTTLLDAGSAGCRDWAGFERHIAQPAITRVLALLSICQSNALPNLVTSGEKLIHLENTIRTVQQNRHRIVGIKLALSGPIIDLLGMDAVRLAVKAARETGTLLMVHVGDLRDPPSARAADLTRELLPLLSPGDIVTHACTARTGGLLDAQRRVLPELRDAVQRGVILDSSQGRTNFGYEVTRRLADQGVVPDVISSDLTGGGRTWIVYSLLECMNKFLALGFGLDAVIRMSTQAPAQALGMSDRLGAIDVGREADLSMLELVPGRWEFQDSFGQSLPCERALVPAATVKAGELIMPDWGPHPWGWEPAPGPSGRA